MIPMRYGVRTSFFAFLFFSFLARTRCYLILYRETRCTRCVNHVSCFPRLKLVLSFLKLLYPGINSARVGSNESYSAFRSHEDIKVDGQMWPDVMWCGSQT